MNAPAPGWQPDPTGRHEQRYWDGAQWTDDVADDDVTALDGVGTRDAATGTVPDPFGATGPALGIDAPGPEASDARPGDSGDSDAAGTPVRKAPPTGLIVGIVVVVLVVLGGAAYALSGGGGDDSDEAASSGGTADAAPETSSSTTAASGDGASGDAGPLGSEEDIIDQAVANVRDRIPELDDDQAECIVRGLFDNFDAEEMIEFSLDDVQPEDLPDEDQQALVEVMRACVPSDVIDGGDGSA